MGRGSRHSKNAGTMGSESMTYAEMKGLGYGTIKERLGKVTTRTLGIRYMLCRSRMLMCSGPHTGIAEQPIVPAGRADIFFPVQDAVGNYYDCRLTLQPAVVSNSLFSCALACSAVDLLHLSGHDVRLVATCGQCTGSDL